MHLIAQSFSPKRTRNGKKKKTKHTSKQSNSTPLVAVFSITEQLAEDEMNKDGRP